MPDEKPYDPAVADRPTSDRLETWGEIAAYLGREIRTVQRWEKTLGLPVRRLSAGPEKLSRVFALKRELDSWWREHEVLRNACEPPTESPPSHPAAETSPQQAQPPSDGASGPFHQRVFQLGGLIAVTVLLTFFVPRIIDYFWPSRVVLGVQPFRNLGDQADDFIAAGFTEEMIARLGQLHPDRLSVVRISASAGSGGSRVRTSYVLQGTVRRLNDQVAVTAQLIQTSNQTVAWGNSYERDVKDVLRVQTDVADAIASEVFNKLPHPAPAREVNRDAYLAYLEGRYFWNLRTAESLQKAVSLFEQSISKDPTYAPAYAGLADCYELQASAPYITIPPKEAFPKAEAAARNALRFDDTLAEAHVSLGYAYLVYEWNFRAAELEFRRALDLQPSYATAHQFYAYYLTAAGRLPEAIVERKKAVDLDPVNPLMASALGEAYYQARQFDQTIAQNRRALELDPRYAVALVNIGRGYQQKAMHAEAQAAFQKILAVAPDDPAVLALLGHEYAVSGRPNDALEVIGRLKNIAARHYVPALYIALIYTGLGDKDGAFRWMNLAVEERTEYLVYLGSEPLADPLRSDPRFADLAKRVGIELPRSPTALSQAILSGGDSVLDRNNRH